MQRCPNLAFLWLGAILVGLQHHAMNWARPVAFQLDLYAAAWTDSSISFIQKPVSSHSPNVAAIPRSDEARLMFLSQAGSHCNPPLVPFAPFGTIAIDDCTLEVRLHALCPGRHGLRYAGWAWDCMDNARVAQDPVGASFPAAHDPAKDAEHDNMVVSYDKLDRDRDCSEAMTRNMFKWLREADGYPVAERDIRTHEWIDDEWTSDDESAAPEGHGGSNTDRRLGPWICKAMTTHCHTI